MRIALFFILAWLLCDISPHEHYTWLSGIWHGTFFIPNLIRSWFGDALYKAVDYTTAYKVWWWITTIGSCLGAVGIGSRPRYMM